MFGRRHPGTDDAQTPVTNGAASPARLIPDPPAEPDSLPDLIGEPPAESATKAPTGRKQGQPVDTGREEILNDVLERIDASAALRLAREELQNELGTLVNEILIERKIVLSHREQLELTIKLVDEMVGYGPLEPLLQDETVTDIMVNRFDQVYVERRGKLEAAEITFRNDSHVMNVAQRIVGRVGRRIDETVPMVDARLPDGSRVNIIAPPLALDGTSISIRKFAKKKITLDVMVRQQNLSEAMATVLKIASASRLNILISGGTGSGKTTLLNAMSRMIDQGERIVTIEDAAELQLQQPHVVRLETRPASIEGRGEITMRGLVKNALRMRPDRIILGEIRGAEAIDMLQAMNTGHDGSLSTIHANSPREALIRLENMISMAGFNLSENAMRTQIASAVDMIVQVERMRDGVRRVVKMSEIVGTEGDVILMQDLFNFDYSGELRDGRLVGTFKYTGLRPHLAQDAAFFGLDRALESALKDAA